MGKGAAEGSKVYDYFGTIAGVVCGGPVDELVAIIVDGKTAWPASSNKWVVGQSFSINQLVDHKGVVYKALQAHTASAANEPPTATHWTRYTLTRATSANPAPITVEGYGSVYLYWGEANQTLDTTAEQILAANGHPAYRRQCVVVLKDFLFGRERTSAPNVEVIVRKKPAQSIITGDASTLSDGQANPVAALADIYTDPVFGAGLTANQPGAPDGTSWQSLAAGLYSSRDQTAISPVIQRGQSLRQITAAMLAYYDGWMRFSTSGTIEAGRFTHNAAPPTFTAATTIDYHDLIDEVSFAGDGWAQTYNQTSVKFADRQRSFKDASVASVSGYNLAVTGEQRSTQVDRPWITRRQQASDHAAELGKINAEPRLTGSLVVRAEKAASIRQGDLFLLTHDALSVSIVCRCTGKDIAQPPAGRVTLRFESDRASAPVPYQPTPAAYEGSAYPVTETLSLQQIVQPPPTLFDGDVDGTILPLIARTSPLTIGAAVWLKQVDLDGFYKLGTVEQFAIYGTVQASYNPTTTYSTTNRARTSNVTTLTIGSHGITAGMTVAVSGLGGTGFSGTFVVSSVGSTTISYANTGADVASTADTGGTVDTGSDDVTEALRVTLDAGTVAADLSKMTRTQTEDAITDNAALVFVFDSTNAKTFEIMTLRSLRVQGAETFYRLKVRRSRFGTTKRNASVGDRVFIVYRTDLVPLWAEQFIQALTNLSTATFRLQAGNAEWVSDLANTTLCPNISYTFNDPYAPAFTFDSVKADGTEVTNFGANYATSVTWSIEATITDASADLTGARLYARNGSQELAIWAATYTPSSRQTVATSWKFPNNGAWQVFLAGVDRSGRVRQKQLTAGGGTASVAIEVRANNDTATPTASPPGGGFSSGWPRSVTLTTTTSGAHIEYQVVNIGAAAGATWTTIAATSGTVQVAADKRLYARAHVSGQNYSTTAYWDFWRETDSYLPPGTQPP